MASASASSSRSLPQNICSPTKKVGAPKMPRRSARSVCARSALLVLPQHGGGQQRVGRQTQFGQGLADRLGIVDIAVLGEIHPHDAAAIGADPGLLGAEQRHAHRQQRPARELARLPPWQAVFGALAGGVDHRVGALGALHHEGRAFPAMCGEHRAEQEGLPRQRHAVPGGQRLDPHRAQIAVVAAELEPELQGGRGRGRHRVSSWGAAATAR
ncbi:hypothetical protein OJJOAM_003712 [Cupriavidus sp. H18C1]